MVLPTMPCFVMGEQIFFNILFVFHHIYYSLCNAYRIEQYAIGILQHIKLYIRQIIADMLGKTRANQQQFVVVGNAWL